MGNRKRPDPVLEFVRRRRPTAAELAAQRENFAHVVVGSKISKARVKELLDEQKRKGS